MGPTSRPGSPGRTFHLLTVLSSRALALYSVSLLHPSSRSPDLQRFTSRIPYRVPLSVPVRVFFRFLLPCPAALPRLPCPACPACPSLPFPFFPFERACAFSSTWRENHPTSQGSCDAFSLISSSHSSHSSRPVSHISMEMLLP
jgi:hypothetical protein